ncbi:MAG: hypothetical protein NVSMB56_10350 [Pyrinomonadaceae bacterium]
MRLLHLIFGILIVLVFLLTGLEMHFHHNHLRGMPDGLRMLYRTRHIFILLAGLLNLGIAAYFAYRPQFWRRNLQLLGSSLVILAAVLYVAAFFYEPTLRDLYTPLSHWATYFILAGTLCHLLSGAWQREVTVINPQKFVERTSRNEN